MVQRLKRRLTKSLAAFVALPVLLLHSSALADETSLMKQGGVQFEISPQSEQSAIRFNLFPDNKGGMFSTAPIPLRIKGKINFKQQDRRVEEVALFKGRCKNETCGTDTLLWHRKNDDPQSSSDGGSLPVNDWLFDQIIEVPGNRLISFDAALHISDMCHRNPKDVSLLKIPVTMRVVTKPARTSGKRGASSRGDRFSGPDNVEFGGGDLSRQVDLLLPVACVQKRI